jgi:hypothetical protein
MSITFDAAASTSGGGVTGLSTSHTSSGSNRGVLIAIHAEGGVTISSLTYGAASPTLVDSTANGIGHMYFLADPATGGQTVSVTFSGSSSRCAMGIVSYNGSVGALSVASFENPAENEAGPDAEATISSAAGQLIVDMATCVGTVWAADTGAGQTERVSLDDYGSTFRCFGMSEKAGAASVVMSWTGTGAEFTNIIAVALQEAAGGGSSIAAIRRYFSMMRANNG